MLGCGRGEKAAEAGEVGKAETHRGAGLRKENGQSSVGVPGCWRGGVWTGRASS